MNLEKKQPADSAALAAAAGRICRALAQENDRLRKENEQMKDVHKTKLKNFREMIERRDARIAKLERKLGIKPRDKDDPV